MRKALRHFCSRVVRSASSTGEEIATLGGGGFSGRQERYRPQVSKREELGENWGK